MKTNLYKIFTAFVLLMALGCGDDDKGPSLPNEDQLEGYWELDEITEDGDEIDFDEFVDGLNGMYYSFDSNGDFEAIVDAGTQEKLEGEWKLDEKSLTLEYATGNELEFEIVSLSENELKVKGEDDDDYTLIFKRIDEEDLPEPEIEITDAASLSSALDIEEAERKSGNIPYPSTGNGVYGKTLDVQTTSVIVTPNSEFDMVLTADAAEGFVFIKLDGTNEYFQIPIDKILTGGRTKYATCAPTIKLTGARGFVEPLDVPATVQTFTMPLQSNQTVDFSNLSFWSPPKRVTFKAIPTGTGSITVTLTWDKDNSDVDLWLIEPDGTKIYYADDLSSTGGYLDYDNTDGFGPENIFYDGDSSPLSGKYEVKVHYYGDHGAGPVNYNVVVQNGSNVNTYRGTLSTDDEVDLVASFNK
jgi:hypothetical protein